MIFLNFVFFLSCMNPISKNLVILSWLDIDISIHLSFLIVLLILPITSSLKRRDCKLSSKSLLCEQQDASLVLTVPSALKYPLMKCLICSFERFITNSGIFFVLE